MTERIVESLPDHPLSHDTVTGLEENERIVQAVPVRGFYQEEGGDGVAFQMILSIPDRGVVGLHIDPFDPGGNWEIVFDSEDIDEDGLMDSVDLYRRAHEALLERSPDLEDLGYKFFEHTPKGMDLGLAESADTEDEDD